MCDKHNRHTAGASGCAAGGSPTMTSLPIPWRGRSGDTHDGRRSGRRHRERRSDRRALLISAAATCQSRPNAPSKHHDDDLQIGCSRDLHVSPARLFFAASRDRGRARGTRLSRHGAARAGRAAESPARGGGVASSSCRPGEAGFAAPDEGSFRCHTVRFRLRSVSALVSNRLLNRLVHSQPSGAPAGKHQRQARPAACPRLRAGGLGHGGCKAGGWPGEPLAIPVPGR